MNTPISATGKETTSIGEPIPPASSTSSTSAVQPPSETTSKPENNATSMSVSPDKGDLHKSQWVPSARHHVFEVSEPCETIIKGIQIYNKVSFKDNMGKQWALEKGMVFVHLHLLNVFLLQRSRMEI